MGILFRNLSLDFPQQIYSSNKAPFWMNGYNKENCKILNNISQYEIRKYPMHSKEVTVRCGFYFGAIHGSYFFDQYSGLIIYVNCQHYRSVVLNCIWTELEDLETNESNVVSIEQRYVSHSS